MNPLLIKINPLELRKLPKLPLRYGSTSSKFGNCLMAFRDNILCFLTFFDGDTPPIDKLEKAWPKCELIEDMNFIKQSGEKLFDENHDHNMKIYLKGTDFEIKVWEALLNIKKGTTVSYEDVAKAVKDSKCVRAAARAVAKNHIAYIIPCHRVIKKDGSLHKFGCGPHRKFKMLQDEGALGLKK